MYKTLCIAVLLLPTFGLAQAPKATTPFSSPLIVAKAKLVNQTAAIPATTIFTPTQSGLYRLSLYMTVSKADAKSATSRDFYLTWTDDAGAENSLALMLIFDNQTPPQAFGGILPPVISFEAAAGTPISYSVFQNGDSDAAAYSLYYTLERLE